MVELFEFALSFHKFFAHFFIVLTIIFFILTRLKGGVKFVKRIRIFLTIYNFCLACLIFTGIIMLPILNFHLHYKVILMMISAFIIIALIAIGYKSLKRACYIKNFSKYKMKMAIFLGIIFMINLSLGFL
ncbi:hypothetical protein F1B92_00560 [Campylobacter sp. FMV-PI01]|uniref:Uncharacterized protein n=1 Tax=Campylobacter portucalensis TaxID=2608384 RepID=A0A6L5WIQ0_9BACT|nr:hypothetical protein [Campylobacter portucalensis]MSN95703.1 hypothetical protein [Campylobacter portucalensis]